MEPPQGSRRGGIWALPSELLAHILDQLVATRDGRLPVAFAQHDAVTRALRALTLVSRGLYRVASRHLYEYCVYLDNCTNYAQFRRTLGLDLGHHPQKLDFGQAARDEGLFDEANALERLKSMFISPQKTSKCEEAPLVRLPQIIDLCSMVGRTLKRLVLDLQPIYATPSEILVVKPHMGDNNIFAHMPNLEELVCSYDINDYFPRLPLNLKRLAITTQGLHSGHEDFCFSAVKLETLVFLRHPHLEAKYIDRIFEGYLGKHVDVVLVDVNANHRTPEGTRDWKEHDRVTIWETDVPKSYYGDDDDLILCDAWIWEQGVRGTLWEQEKRRMLSWSEIEAKMAGIG
ncbi:hypothetical protein BS50DRAFT_626555 [Corynespora cassiicola Philippines]|uniref:Uncharacterized protein n=1 Tax=Corynespora cassiicola Philippines TaxID=1448308 RepID=A0A2T2N2K0_CORCC|nr:hypothetical protein BS50DRAFT_626555 [Corynespora cassiicola Philippines]